MIGRLEILKKVQREWRKRSLIRNLLNTLIWMIDGCYSILKICFIKQEYAFTELILVISIKPLDEII